jgi:hypothetical protein
MKKEKYTFYNYQFKHAVIFPRFNGHQALTKGVRNGSSYRKQRNQGTSCSHSPCFTIVVASNFQLEVIRNEIEIHSIV